MNPSVIQYEREWAENQLLMSRACTAELYNAIKCQKMTAGKHNSGKEQKGKEKKGQQRQAAMKKYNDLFREVADMPYKYRQNRKLYKEKCALLKQLKQELSL